MTNVDFSIQDVVSRGTNTEGENFEALYERAMLERDQLHSHVIELQKSLLQVEQNRPEVYVHIFNILIFHFRTNM